MSEKVLDGINWISDVIKFVVNSYVKPNKNAILYGGIIWIGIDIIYIYKSRNNKDKWYKYGPITYIFNKKGGINDRYKISEYNDNTYFGIFRNVQFTSKFGLASNMLGGYFLGILLCAGIYEYNISTDMNNPRTTFSIYLMQSSMFYTLEYIWCAIFHPHKLDLDAFILYTHSNEFHYAILFSLFEFFIGNYIGSKYPKLSILKDIKRLNTINKFGLFLVLFGQSIRTIAQFTAGVSFTHQIALQRKDKHKLVTSGIYKYIRHPSYCGFFYWSIGTQLLLGNPISFIGYFISSWIFFYQRVPYEEEYLIQFFGDEYIEYRKKTPGTLIPFNW